MSKNHKSVSAVPEILRCGPKTAAFATALAMLLPGSAVAMDSTPKQTFDQAGHALSLPPVRYLDSMRWMDWKPGAPVFKVDTLLLPDRLAPGTFRLPSDYERNLPSIS
jgi:hypothetical protein